GVGPARRDRRRTRDRCDLGATLAPSGANEGPRLVGVGIRPVVELAPAAARRQPADVRTLAVSPFELLFGHVAVLIPLVVLFGDAEIDESSVPDVGEPHFQGILTSVENGSDADEGGAFLDRYPVILARPHGQLREAALGGELAQAAEVRAG